MADDGDLGFIDGLGLDFSGCICGLRLFLRFLCAPCGSLLGRRENVEHGIQQIIDTTPVFSGNGEHLPDPQAMELVHDGRLLFGVGLVDGKEERASSLAQQADQFKIGSGERGAAVDYHDDGGGLIKGNPGLAKNFRRNEIFIVGKNSAGVDDAHAAAAPLRLAVEPVAGDSGLVTDDGAARAHNAVEQR